MAILRNNKMLVVVGLLVLAVSLLLSACQTQTPIVGTWRDQGPASLVYEFRDDGKVYMLMHGKAYFYFQYQLLDDNTLRLYDGMGRHMDYKYTIEGDIMTLFDPAGEGEVKRVFVREPAGEQPP